MYLNLTELFEIERFICIKMDLALNKLERLICHKTQTNKQIREIVSYYRIQAVDDLIINYVEN